MKIVLYSDIYKDSLSELLRLFSKEVFGNCAYDIDRFVDGHWAIYLAIQNDRVVGFSSFIVNDYYGLRSPTLGNDYIYVLPEHRTSKAMYLFSIQAGKICIDNNLPLEHYYSSESSLRLSRKLKGKKIYETYIYDVGDVSNTFNKLINKVRIKDEN
jgi:hypothetical protein